MVDLRVILRLVEFISCILYNSVALIVIPDCTEVITFYTKIVTTAHVGVEEQIQSLKSVVAHILSPYSVSVSGNQCNFAKVLDQNGSGPFT